MIHLDWNLALLFQTLLGQVFGGFCALVGVFTLTLPLPIVVNSFAGCYKNRLWRNEVAQKKKMRVNALKDKEETNNITAESLQALIKAWLRTDSIHDNIPIFRGL